MKYLLLILFLNAPEGLQGWIELEVYDSHVECIESKKYVQQSMIEAYGTHDFLIKCVPKEGKPV